MHLDPIMPHLVGSILAVILLALLMRYLRQPSVIGYLLAGIIIGPHGFAVLEDTHLVGRLGALGVVLLLFFIGMEVAPRHIIEKWKVALLGTLLQIAISVGLVWPLGFWLDWPLQRIILMGFVISLSSTSVVLKLLNDWSELNSRVGQNVLMILLAQDLAIIPMLMLFPEVGDAKVPEHQLLLQLAGSLVIAGVVIYIARRGAIHLPLRKWLQNDHEIQIFSALAICLGLALVTGLAGLSAALGAFVAGMIVGAARETQWVHHSLESFRVVLVALFFASVGMLVDLNFVKEQWIQIVVLVFLVVVVNTFINGVIQRVLGETWRDSLYAGSILSQIGEFSFVLAAVGIQAQVISNYGYQLTVSVITLSLILSPPWIMFVRFMIQRL